MLKKYLSTHAKEINKKIEEFLPLKIEKEWIEKNLPDYKENKETINNLIIPIQDILNRDGKKIRPILMQLCYNAIKKDTENDSLIKELLPLPEIIHNGTLIIDDIEDNSQIRRKKPCTHHKFGVDVAINSGNMMYYLPYLILEKLKIKSKEKLKIHELIANEMLKLHIGQGTDIYWHKCKNPKVTPKDYMQMCAYKTGTLLKISAKIGAIIANATKEQTDAIEKFAETIGIAFQIQDDILNITNDNWGKEFAEDITEGKKSLMVVRAIQKANEKDKDELLKILNKKTKNQKLIKKAIFILEKYNTIKYARKKSKKIVKRAWKKLDPIIKESDSKNKLKLFSDYLITREI